MYLWVRKTRGGRREGERRDEWVDEKRIGDGATHGGFGWKKDGKISVEHARWTEESRNGWVEEMNGCGDRQMDGEN